MFLELKQTQAPEQIFLVGEFPEIGSLRLLIQIIDLRMEVEMVCGFFRVSGYFKNALGVPQKFDPIVMRGFFCVLGCFRFLARGFSVPLRGGVRGTVVPCMR